jgi:hypothetical protein
MLECYWSQGQACYGDAENSIGGRKPRFKSAEKEQCSWFERGSTAKLATY